MIDDHQFSYLIFSSSKHYSFKNEMALKSITSSKISLDHFCEITSWLFQNFSKYQKVFHSYEEKDSSYILSLAQLRVCLMWSKSNSLTHSQTNFPHSYLLLGQLHDFDKDTLLNACDCTYTALSSHPAAY